MGIILEFKKPEKIEILEYEHRVEPSDETNVQIVVDIQHSQLNWVLTSDGVDRLIAALKKAQKQRKSTILVQKIKHRK